MQRLQKNNITIFNTEVDPDDVIDLRPGNNGLILSRREKYSQLADYVMRDRVALQILDDKLFNRVKFNIIKEIKKRPAIESRVLPFEYDDKDFIKMLDKRDRLIEMRKTKEERQSDVEINIFIMNWHKTEGLEYYGELRRD